MTCTLKELIHFLERCPPESTVVYDSGKIPRSSDSWRGSYSELALSEDGTSPIIVADILKDLRKALSVVFTGYKGGSYQMNGGSKIYCDNWGEYTDTHIIGGTHRDGVVILKTERPQETAWEVLP